MPTIIENTTYLTTREAAELLGRHAGTLRNWHSDGAGPIKPRKIGGELFWRMDEVQRVTDTGK